MSPQALSTPARTTACISAWRRPAKPCGSRPAIFSASRAARSLSIGEWETSLACWRSCAPEGGCRDEREHKRKSPAENRGALSSKIMKRRKRSVLGRPGGDLLFQALGLSTIGAEDFDGRVRDGIGYRLLAMTTRPAKDGSAR